MGRGGGWGVVLEDLELGVGAGLCLDRVLEVCFGRVGIERGVWRSVE